MTAPGALPVSSDGSFPNVERLCGQLGPEAARQLALACGQLRSAGAPTYADRLASIDKRVGLDEYRILRKLADPELAEDELDTARQRHVRRAHAARNVLALMPLLITWIALGVATWEYKNYLHSHRDQSNQPFLLLWERGFGHGPWMSFAYVAFYDVAFLLAVLAATIWVHHAEVREARPIDRALAALHAALDTLEAAMERNIVRAPASAEEWAGAAQQIIGGAMEQTRLLAETGQKSIEQASAGLAGIQRDGRDFIGEFSGQVRQVLQAMQEENAQLFSKMATETSETLQRLAEQQMAPLLQQLSGLLDELRKHQEAYRAATANLAGGVVGVREATRELTDSVQSSAKVTDSMSKSIAAIESTQRDFTDRVTTSADSMVQAATAMGEFRGAMREMRDGVAEMAAGITGASATLDVVQRKLADTSTALSDSTAALNKATRDLRGTTRGGAGRRRRFLFWRR
jgi:methyl-accepting chemotaxis protein